MVSSLVFMTNGPRRAIGSPIGHPGYFHGHYGSWRIVPRKISSKVAKANGADPLKLDSPFRAARVADTPRVAELFRISGEGVTDVVWDMKRGDYPGLSLLEIGARRYASEEGNFSYRKCVVGEVDGEVVANLHAYVMGGEPIDDLSDGVPERDLSEVPEVLRPYAALELPGSYYISGVAVLPAHRNRGLGVAMLEIARRAAVAEECAEMSLIVFAQNVGAHRLYLREVWREVDRRAIVEHPMIHFSGDAILMRKPV